MIKLTKAILACTAMLGVALTGTAQAEPDYPYAATGFISAGGSWLDVTGGGPVIIVDDEREIATIIAGGDFVIPQNGYWNVQLGGAFHTDHEHFTLFGGSGNTQFQAGAIAFWRDPAMGVFGIEVGLYSQFEGERKYVKVGGVAEYFFGDMATIGGFGGAFVPFGDDNGDADTGFYAGGHATWYVSQTLALAAFAKFTELSASSPFFSSEDEYLTVGGKVRHLTAMPGVEVYASAAYAECNFNFNNLQSSGFFRSEGAKVMAGVKVRLGGHTDSLVSVDRSNALDTRAWSCDG